MNNTKINKAVYSFWTKPYREHEWKTIGEFRSEESFLSSWSLSVMYAKKHFEKVELYIDKEGWEMLEPLNLPFTKVHVTFEDLDKYHNELWSISKIYTYLLQDEPFIHLDSDVYLWVGLPEKYQNSEILLQNNEDGYGFYKDMLVDYIDRFWGSSDVIDDFITKNGISKVIVFNCGVFGGTNIDFIKEYARKSIDFADVINEKLKSDPAVKYSIPCFFEQSLLAMMLDLNNTFPSLIMEGNEFPNPRFPYTHLAAGAKKAEKADAALKRRLKKDYPAMANLIKEIAK